MKNMLLSAAIAGAILASNMPADAFASADKEKCYGIAKAGKNDCAAADGSHSCAGKAKADNLPTEWTFVKAGECAKMGGTTTAPAAKK